MKRKVHIANALMIIIALCIAVLFIYIFQLKSSMAEMQESLSAYEEKSTHQVYALQKQMDEATATNEKRRVTRETCFADALRAGKIKTVLILGDSITDGNGDRLWLSDQEQRAAMGNRKIFMDENQGGGEYYESVEEGQGWVKYFRNYLFENTSVTLVHNNAIGGKSAKWGNANKEQWIPDTYDAIFVMLGTNDRWDCRNQQEFYTEYSQLLKYAASKCSYLTVLTPPPGFEGLSSQNAMNTREIADTVLELCSANNYCCINLYNGLLEQAANWEISLDELILGVHPTPKGYLVLWRLIALQLGINLEINEFYDANMVPENISEAVIDIGVNRDDISEKTKLSALDANGRSIYGIGDSLYYTTNPFIDTVPYGGNVVTHRDANETGYQIFKPFYYPYDFVRHADADGKWLPWSITNRDPFYKEE